MQIIALILGFIVLAVLIRAIFKVIMCLVSLGCLIIIIRLIFMLLATVL